MTQAHDPRADQDAAREAHLRIVAKRELRTRMRSVRAVLPHSARAARSAAAVARIQALPEYQSARVIVAFSAIQKELDLAELLADARSMGKQTGLPKVVGDELQLRAVSDPSALVQGAFDILEPNDDAPIIAPESIDLVLVPGLAFDGRGHRIGYGRAFYDRLLPSMPRAFRVGVAYDFQLLAELPNDPHDIPMHCIVSDARCLRVE